jgi:hypothetical protein
MNTFYIPNAVDGLASVLESSGYFDEVSYEEEPVDCLRTTHLTKAGTTVDITEYSLSSGARYLYIDGIDAGGGSSSSDRATRFVGGYATDNGIVLSPILGTTSYPSSLPFPEEGGRAPLIICETEEHTLCLVFLHKNSSSIVGQVPSSAGTIELKVISIDTEGVKTVWTQDCYMAINNDNVLYSAPIFTGKELVKGVSVCLNRCFGGKEGVFTMSIQNETYASVARNGFLIKTT